MMMKPTDMISLLNRALASDFRVMPMYTPDTPVFLAVALPVAEGVTGQKPRLPAGRGLTLQQAMVSAGAEAMELRASLAQSHLGALATAPQGDGVALVACNDLASGEVVMVPAQDVFLDCAATLGEPLRTDANSTGCAVAPTREEAAAIGLWECVERDAMALWWHGGRQPAALSLEAIDTVQPRLGWWLEQRVRPTRLLDLTSDIGLPVVAAVSCDPDGGRVAIGTAARPQRAEAALAAVTELMQTEISLDEALQAGDPEALIWANYGRIDLPAFATGAARAEPAPMHGRDLLARLGTLGHRVLSCDMTLPGDPMPSLRVLVPGLCAMGGRIGTERFRRLCPGMAGPHVPEPY